VYGKPASIKEQHENEGTERLMIGNVPELQEAPRREIVVGEVGTMAPEFLAAVPFAIHVAMQWISFEIIAKCSIENEIVKSTNLKDIFLLSEGLSVEVNPLPHCIILLPLDFIPLPLLFIPPPHFFIPLPQHLLKHFDLLSFFREARDEATPPVLYDDDATFWALTFQESTMPFSMEYLQHVLHKNISRHCKDKGLEWNHWLTVHGSFPLC
jgi:hypothetical protein